MTETQSDTQTCWTKHKTPPFRSDRSFISHIFNLNETQLLLLVEEGTELDSLWTYDICNENYTKKLDMSSWIELDQVHHYTSSFDNNKSLVYLFGENAKIVKINLKTKQFELSLQRFHDGSHSKSLFINNQFHIFGGWFTKDKSHFIGMKINKI
eukprot:544124_1